MAGKVQVVSRHQILAKNPRYQGAGGFQHGELDTDVLLDTIDSELNESGRYQQGFS